MARSLIALLLVATSAGCYCSHARELDAGALDSGAHDAAMIDAPMERFDGCDDPRLWEAPALEATPEVYIGGGPCSPAQYPAHGAGLAGRPGDDFPREEWPRLTRSCWRVTAAHPESRWDVGLVLASERPYLGVAVIGHERPVTFEGRVIRDDGVVRLAVHDAIVALDAPWVLDEDLTDLVALGMTEETLARAHSVSLSGVEHATEGEVIAATATRNERLIWLERVGSEVFLRAAGRAPASEVRSISLGSPAEAHLAPRAAVVVLERHELVIFDGDPDLVHRIVLADEVESIVAGWPAVIVHAGGELIAFDYDGVEQSRLAVGEGTLLPGPSDWYQPPFFWDGSRVVAIDARGALALDDERAIEPTPEDLAIAGELIAVGHGALIGREGFVNWPRYGPAQPGPQAVGTHELYGGVVTHVAADMTSYVVTRPDGSSTLYRVPFVDWCD